jgi:DNA-binding transcriptional MerR regulator
VDAKTSVTSEQRWRIGQLAERLGLNPRTIRYYERIQILPEPERTHAGYRLYGPGVEERLRFIKSAQRIGLNLGEIKEVLAFRERGQPPCGYVAGVIEQRLSEVDQRLRELRAFKADLSRLRERMRAEGVAERDRYCHYIETAAGSRS